MLYTCRSAVLLLVALSSFVVQTVDTHGSRLTPLQFSNGDVGQEDHK